MTTHVGRAYEVMSAEEKTLTRMLKSDELVEYSDTTVDLFTLPAYTMLVEFICRVDTAFDQSATIQLGDGTTADLFGTLESSLGTASAATISGGIRSLRVMRELTSATTIRATVTCRGGTGVSLAAGKTSWWMVFKPLTLDRGPD